MNYFKYLITVGKASLLGLLVVILMGILPIIIEEGPFDTGMYFWLSVISLVLIILFVRSIMMYRNYKIYNIKLSNLFNLEKHLSNKNNQEK